MKPLCLRPHPSLSILGALLCASCATLPVAGAENAEFPPHAFTLPDGYTLDLAVPPTLVPRPIHMCFDEEGALYVTDSSGNTDKAPVQLKTPEHRILRLIDRDGDGVFDESTVFAEKVPFPEGILVYEGEVYVGAPPHIWKFTDTDGDHVADEREPWFDGGSIGPCGNDMHGPYLAPDGYFYWCKGGFEEQSLRLGDGQQHQGRAAHIFRAKPDGSELEVVITGGMNNPVGLAFSETGERFLSGTFFDLSQPGRRDGILHAVYGGMYGRKNPRVLAERPHTGSLLPILTQMGPAAPSGIVMPRNDSMGFKGDLFCADFNLNRISRHRLSPSGSSYALETEIFFKSNQREFHPTDVIEDADGSLLVADTGSWYKICCPTSTVAKPKSLGGIYRIRKASAPALEDPRGLELDWEKPSVAYLSDSRPAVVTRAIDALAEEKRLDELDSSEALLPATWAMHRIPGEAARKALRERILHDNTEVRAAAIHSAALWRDVGAVPSLIDTLTAEDALLRRLAAMALGRVGDPMAVAPLLQAATAELDAFSRHAITYALYEIGDDEAVSGDHRFSKQLQQMRDIAGRDPAPHSRPEIQWADPVEVDSKNLAQQKARLAELGKLLPKGNAKRGKEIFNNPAKSLCITCHVKGEEGVNFGPDLTRIGAIRSGRDLLEAIVFPSASIARYYEIVTVRTKGAETSGLVLEDGVDQLILATAPGAGVPIPLEEITEAKYSNLSLMPQVFDGLLKPEEIADLIAYLATAK
ncbi:HEAT repeat domain-containing protein [Akkermansiaceae bacterium]|nr:HEAT repeat domain-containing protein [Akkermansiaceae bacterium]